MREGFFKSVKSFFNSKPPPTPQQPVQPTSQKIDVPRVYI